MNKSALVTGGTKGLGLAIVECLKEHCQTVIATYNTTPPNVEFPNVLFRKVDVTDQSSCDELLKNLDDEGIYPNILVNNAGVVKDVMFHKMDRSAWNEVLNVNLNSIFNLTQPIYSRMRQEGFGRIINISSVNANKGQIGQANYCASKAGIQGFTKALALEGAHKNITVNTISPGYCQTDMLTSMKPEVLEQVINTIPARRLGKPEEIAHLVAYLISENAGYVSGANFEINGGLYSS
ncbi:SDR family oxidoreductase [Pseudoalteromonas sp. S4498]|uniref:3-oxoacyl-ACP reductase n=1 Tax=Pseudoalteromonas galatheae TaxID=579562 RepID=UPI0011091DE0|nr:3-oxoacyl-ACP reductase [Pseudoalteromonas galatheae]NKC17450.1 SDR family oxidoreductase [Pseudoalteromonas galatheae]